MLPRSKDQEGYLTMGEREAFLGAVQDLAFEEFGYQLDEIVLDVEIFELAFSYLFKLIPEEVPLQFDAEAEFIEYCWENRRRLMRIISV